MQRAGASLVVANGLICMWDLNSLTRDQTRVACLTRQIFNSGLPGKSPMLLSVN